MPSSPGVQSAVILPEREWERMFVRARRYGPSFISEAMALFDIPPRTSAIGRYAWSEPTSAMNEDGLVKSAAASSLFEILGDYIKTP